MVHAVFCWHRTLSKCKKFIVDEHQTIQSSTSHNKAVMNTDTVTVQENHCRTVYELLKHYEFQQVVQKQSCISDLQMKQVCCHWSPKLMLIKYLCVKNLKPILKNMVINFFRMSLLLMYHGCFAIIPFIELCLHFTGYSFEVRFIPELTVSYVTSKHKNTSAMLSCWAVSDVSVH